MLKLLTNFWNRVLEMPTGLPPQLDMPEPPAPDNPKVVDPHAERGPESDEAHTWKSHGGYRH